MRSESLTKWIYAIILSKERILERGGFELEDIEWNEAHSEVTSWELLWCLEELGEITGRG